MTKEEIYEQLLLVLPNDIEQIAKDLCNHFPASQLEEFVYFLEDEHE